MKKISTAIIGLGRIAWSFHIPQFLNHDGFDVVGIVDPIEERLNETECKFNIKNKYSSIEELYKQEKPELVVIASPTVFHKEQIIYAFQNGSDVFSDKPLSLSLSETEEIIDAQRKYCRKLMVYQPRRLDVDCFGAKELIESDKVGQIYAIKRVYSSYVRRNDWQSCKKYGGGMLKNYGAHFIDQLLYIFDDVKIKEIYCSLERIASLGDAEDSVNIILKTDKNLTLHIDINQASAFEENSWSIMGKNGGASYNAVEKKWKIKYFKNEDLPDIKLQTQLAAEDRKYTSETIPWRIETWYPVNYFPVNFLDKCYDYYALNEKPFVKIENTIEVMRIIEECDKQNTKRGGI